MWLLSWPKWCDIRRRHHLQLYECPRNFEEQRSERSLLSTPTMATYFGNIVFDMYKNWSDTAPLSNSWCVHYGNNYENAFWDGKAMTFEMVKVFHPLVSLDVSAHEVSHGFTEQTQVWFYANQSGGMERSFWYGRWSGRILHERYQRLDVGQISLKAMALCVTWMIHHEMVLQSTTHLNTTMAWTHQAARVFNKALPSW